MRTIDPKENIPGFSPGLPAGTKDVASNVASYCAQAAGDRPSLRYEMWLVIIKRKFVQQHKVLFKPARVCPSQVAREQRPARHRQESRRCLGRGWQAEGWCLWTHWCIGSGGRRGWDPAPGGRGRLSTAPPGDKSWQFPASKREVEPQSRR